jgi:hypothetical protein
MLSSSKIAESMTFRQWLAICSLIDKRYGHGTKFDVIQIIDEPDKRKEKITTGTEQVDFELAA